MQISQLPQFARFLLVGGINTGFSYGVYVVLLYVGLHYALANLSAVVIGIFFSFRTQGHFVFGNRANKLIFRFAACWGLIWLINILLISTFIRAGLNAYWAGALALIPVVALSFILQKVFVFKPTRR